MLPPIYIATDTLAVLSIAAAAHNSVHTWWINIIRFVLLGMIYVRAGMYADAAWQFFFIGTSIIGWWWWLRGNHGDKLPVSRMTLRAFAIMLVISVVVTAGYQALRFQHLSASSLYIGSAMLALGVMVQLLRMRRMLETWMFQIVISLAVIPNSLERKSYYGVFFGALYVVICLYGLWYWRRKLKLESKTLPQVQTAKET
jgi:nicotinamide mononucleotide transporter